MPLALGLGLGLTQIGGSRIEETVIEGPGGIGSPIGLLLILTKAS